MIRISILRLKLGFHQWRKRLVKGSINDKNLNSEIETPDATEEQVESQKRSMIRISILRLKQSGSAVFQERDISSINDKNLNSEIETSLKGGSTVAPAVTINDKNLNSEIETPAQIPPLESMLAADQ